MLLPIHIAAGGLAIVLGAVALSVKKGGTIHRRSGLLFVYAMLVMGISASILGFLKSPTDGNVFAGFMTAYFVGTALTTVRPRVAMDPPYQCRGADGRGRTRARRDRGRREGLQQPSAFPRRRPVSHDRRDVLRPRHRPDRWRRPATCASCDPACLAAGRAWRAICGGCASRCSSRPDRSSRSVSAWRKSFPSRSRPGRCARCRSCCCSARCSIGCGGSAAAARCQCSSDTIRSRYQPHGRLPSTDEPGSENPNTQPAYPFAASIGTAETAPVPAGTLDHVYRGSNPCLPAGPALRNVSPGRL